MRPIRIATLPRRSFVLPALLAAVLSFAVVSTVQAMSEAPSSGGSQTHTKTKKSKCPKGKTYDAKSHKCVTAKADAGADDELYARGYRLAKAEEQLAEIKKICGTKSEPYRELSKAIARSRSGQPSDQSS